MTSTAQVSPCIEQIAIENLARQNLASDPLAVRPPLLSIAIEEQGAGQQTLNRRGVVFL